jgi:hypothetical protein
MGIENESRVQSMRGLEKKASAKIWTVTPRMRPNCRSDPPPGSSTRTQGTKDCDHSGRPRAERTEVGTRAAAGTTGAEERMETK